MSFFGPDLRNGLPIGLGSLTALARAVAAVAPPPPPATDSFFKYVTLLLHGDGTNGAQNNTFLDGSTNAFTITRNGNTTQGTFSPFSQTGWSNYFDGTGDYLTAADNAAFQLGTSDFTIEFWLYPLSSAGWWIVGKGDAATASGSAISFWNGGQWQVYYGGTALNIGQPTITLNAWQHIAVVRNGTSITIYKDGVGLTPATIGTNSINTGGANPLQIGSYSTTGYTGYVSSFRFVKGTAVYTANFTPPTSPLTNITNTSLLTCQSNRFIDNSSNAFDITRNGDVRVEAFSPFNPSTTYSTANVGGSGYFDGTGDYLASTATTISNFGTDNFTFECWVYRTAIGTDQGIYDGRPTSGNGAYFSTVILGSTNKFVVLNNGVIAYTTVAVIPSGSWLHIAVVRTGTGTNQSNVYINGALDGSYTDATNYINALNTIGAVAFTPLGAAPFNGYISNLRIVKGTAVYTANFTPPTAPLTAITNTSLLLNFTNGGVFDNASQTVLETVGNAQVSTTEKKYGTGSMYFDGTGDWLIAPDRPPLRFGTGAFTIEGWVYYTGASARSLLGKGTSTSGWNVSIDAVGALTFTYGTSTIAAGIVAIPSATWTHFAIVREGTGTNQTKLYIDGINDGTGTVSTNFNQTNVMYIGANRTGGDALNGYIDDLRITNGYARYTANFTPPTAAFPDN